MPARNRFVSSCAQGPSTWLHDPPDVPVSHRFALHHGPVFLSEPTSAPGSHLESSASPCRQPQPASERQPRSIIRAITQPRRRSTSSNAAQVAVHVEPPLQARRGHAAHRAEHGPLRPGPVVLPEAPGHPGIGVGVPAVQEPAVVQRRARRRRPALGFRSTPGSSFPSTCACSRA